MIIWIENVEGVLLNINEAFKIALEMIDEDYWVLVAYYNNHPEYATGKEVLTSGNKLHCLKAKANLARLVNHKVVKLV